MPTARLSGTFTAVIGGGTGADGLALVILDAETESECSLGSGGAGLG